MWAHFSLLGVFFSLLAASWVLLCHCLLALAVFLLSWATPGSILEGSGESGDGFGGSQALFFEVFCCACACDAKNVRQAFRIVKTNTKRMSAILCGALKTAKNRSGSSANAAFHEGRANVASEGSPGSILEGSASFLGASWAHLGCSWAPLGRCWPPLGRFLAASWSLLGSF